MPTPGAPMQILEKLNGLPKDMPEEVVKEIMEYIEWKTGKYKKDDNSK